VAAAAFLVEAKQNSLKRQRTSEKSRMYNKSRKSEIATRMKKVGGAAAAAAAPGAGRAVAAAAAGCCRRQSAPSTAADAWSLAQQQQPRQGGACGSDP
jgi:ribosomal protein S20